MRDVRTDASDVLAVYTSEVARHPILSREEEYQVGMRAMEGDKEAQDTLVNSNLRFVIRRAKRFDGRGVPLMDLINAGNIGLIHAARKYDPSMGYKLISYATRWIDQQMQREIDATKDDVRETPTQHVRIRRIRSLNARARQQIGRVLTMQELMAETDYTEAMINEALEYRVTIKGFDDPVSANDESSTTLAQVIGAEDDRADREAEEELQQAVAQMMSAVLSPRESLILQDYFGFGGRREMSLTEIGESQGVTRERARQIKERALKKIREASGFHPMLQNLYVTFEAMEERRRRIENQIPEAKPFVDTVTTSMLQRERELARERRMKREQEQREAWEVEHAPREATLEADDDAVPAGAAGGMYVQGSLWETQAA